jgi:hypothetical protein
MRVSNGTVVIIGVGSMVGVEVLAGAPGEGVAVGTVGVGVGSGVSVASATGVAVAWTRGGSGFVAVGESGGGSQQPLTPKASTITPSIDARSIFRFIDNMAHRPIRKGAG